MKKTFIDSITVEWHTSIDEAKQAVHSMIRNEIRTHDSGLILLSGGSSASVAVTALNGLDLESFEVTQVDERYGKQGHNDSNWKLLLDSGLDPHSFMNTYPVLAMQSKDHASAGAAYNSMLEDRMSESEFSLGILGMGGDGHISGMLPNDEASFEQFLGEDFAVAYTGPDFERLTSTATAIQHMDSVILFATGPEKRAQLEKLEQQLPIHEQPAQMLKECSNVTIIFGED